MTPCKQLEVLKKERVDVQNSVNQLARECEHEKYGKFINKYFSPEKNTVKDLINCVYTIHKKNPHYELSLKQFIDMFPRDSPVESTNFKRQHVFEHICRFLLQFNFDEGEFGNPKKFYQSLERFNRNTSVPLTNSEMLNEKINTGSSAQSVDIFFEISNKKPPPQWACMNTIEKRKGYVAEEEEETMFILIQCKYYETEKSDISKYDVPKMLSRANILQQHIGTNYRVALMVNDKDALGIKFKRSRFSYVLDTEKDVYGVNQIDEWFKRMLQKAILYDTFDDFINMPVPKKHPLKLRFHQEWFINITYSNLKKNKKYVWGAVPRSGKSYMIGGMIARRQKTSILILGAKSETEKQFQDVFTHHSDFDNFKIVGTRIIQNQESSSPTIYIWSQEYLKDKILKGRRGDVPVFKQAFTERTICEELFNTENISIDIYFDEIHNGGSTDKSRTIIDALLNSGRHIDIGLFVMSTATFMKPTIAYDKMVFDEKPPLTIEWTYEDVQLMKTISQPHSLETFLSTKPKDSITKLLARYEMLYGNSYLQVLEEDYSRSPELVIIQPSIAIDSSISTILKNAFTLECTAFNYANQTEINDLNKIFSQYAQIRDILKVIAGEYETKSRKWKLTPNTMYGYLKYKMKYAIDNPHTELWYLPVSNLYLSDCKDIAKLNSKYLKKHNGLDADGEKTSIPHVEPITRGLAVALMEHPYFKEKCCVLIVHEDYSLFQSAGQMIDCISAYSSKTSDMTTFIKEKEFEAYKSQKSLIILAAHKLRLGVSLPCADIAFNFDNVKSVDTNYQTMFRVLTERPAKKYGFYIDFNLDRAIDFIYEYGAIYNNKNSPTVDDDVYALQHLLLQFNYNGLNLMQNDKYNKMYAILVDKMSLNRKGYIERMSNITNMSKMIEDILITTGKINEYSELYELIKGSLTASSKKQVRVVIKDGIKGERMIISDDMEEKGTVNNEINKAKLISKFLPVLPPLFALFAYFDCTTFDDCLNSAIRQTGTLKDALCDCMNEYNNPLVCYFESSAKVKQILQITKSLLKDNLQIHSRLKLSFESIREKHLHTDIIEHI